MTSTTNQITQTTLWYRGPNVPTRAIRRFARQVAEQFQPDIIILFGSHAYGQPHADSDVDILVVMPARNQLDQAAKIQLATLPPFSVHLLVRTPRNLAWRLAEGDSFLLEIVSKGKVVIRFVTICEYRPMKTLIVTIPDDLYQNAEQHAAKQGATLTQQIVVWIQQFARTEKSVTPETSTEAGCSNPDVESPDVESPDVERLLGSLDRAKNIAPLGRLRREELYDRAIVR